MKKAFHATKRSTARWSHLTPRATAIVSGAGV